MPGCCVPTSSTHASEVVGEDVCMVDSLTRRLEAAGEDVDELIDLGCDLADAGRHDDAETCFRRASAQGDAVALFNCCSWTAETSWAPQSNSVAARRQATHSLPSAPC
jgi:hypothetical protein